MLLIFSIPRYDRNPSFPVHPDCKVIIKPDMRDKIPFFNDMLIFQNIPVKNGVLAVMLNGEIADVH